MNIWTSVEFADTVLGHMSTTGALCVKYRCLRCLRLPKSYLMRKVGPKGRALAQVCFAPFVGRPASMPMGCAWSLCCGSKTVTHVQSLRLLATPQGYSKSVLEALVMANHVHKGDHKTHNMVGHAKVFVGLRCRALDVLVSYWYEWSRHEQRLASAENDREP